MAASWTPPSADGRLILTEARVGESDIDWSVCSETGRARREGGINILFWGGVNFDYRNLERGRHRQRFGGRYLCGACSVGGGRHWYLWSSSNRGGRRGQTDKCSRERSATFEMTYVGGCRKKCNERVTFITIHPYNCNRCNCWQDTVKFSGVFRYSKS